MDIYNPNIQEGEAGGLLQFKARQIQSKTLCIKKKKVSNVQFFFFFKRKVRYVNGTLMYPEHKDTLQSGSRLKTKRERQRDGSMGEDT